jgi:transposase
MSRRQNDRGGRLATVTMEIITGVERRRRWSLEEKLGIVAETGQPGFGIAEIDRRYEISRGLLWNWRSQVRRGVLRREALPVFLLPRWTTAGRARVVGDRRDRGCCSIGTIKTVGAGTDVDAALAGRLDTFGAIDAHQPQDTEAGAESLLGVRPGLEGQFNQASGRWTELSALGPQPGRRPIGVPSVCARHVVEHN